MHEAHEAHLVIRLFLKRIITVEEQTSLINDIKDVVKRSDLGIDKINAKQQPITTVSITI